jgi:deoxyguanosine kinase
MYLAIEGVIGVGKTTLARLLRPMFNATLLLEVFEENPFLSNFYGDRARYAFQTQIFFLLSRYHQQKAVPQTLESGGLISDYTFEKDALFARLNLQSEELNTYLQVYHALGERTVKPDLIVYLRVSTEVAMQRIAMRDRPYERDMDIDYIHRLNLAYEQHFSEEFDSRVLMVDSSHLDFVANPDDLDLIANHIRSRLGITPYQRRLPLNKEQPI